MTIPAEAAPAVFLPEPARLAYWRAGQAAYASGAEQLEAIRAGIAAATAAMVEQHHAQGGPTRPLGLHRRTYPT